MGWRGRSAARVLLLLSAVVWGGQKEYAASRMGVVKKKRKGRRPEAGALGCGVGVREEMRVPGLVGDFEMASMTCKGRW
jgi:hypothetical protein